MISGISGFSFLGIEHIRKPETTENFDELIFQGIKTIYLISNLFLDILCVQDTTLKVLLKVIHETQHWSLKVAFLVIKAKMVLDNKLVAFKQFSGNGNC